ncbi:hypothetical protein F5B18DRAFT_316887 [Nemania serpens]|nr:hypothetical protein F5B18DRAFT_316887 [Nemania serpens]
MGKARAIAWHFLENQFGLPISYANAGKDAHDSLDGLRSEHLRTAQSIVGWCERVKNVTDNAQFPRLSEYKIVLNEIKLSAGLKAYFLATVGWTRTKRERELESIEGSRGDEGWNGEMKFLGQEYVILFDTAVQRGWLVNGQRVLLHLLRASLENDCDQLSSYLSRPDVGGISTEEAVAQPNMANMVAAQAVESRSGPAFVLAELGKTARRHRDHSGSLLTSDDFRKFRKLTLNERETIEDGDDAIQDNEVYVERRLMKLLEGLWKMMNQKGQVHSQELNILEGYDFWDLARCRSPLSPNAIKLSAVAEGWIEFTRSLGAVTLFASGFGTLLRPDYGEEQDVCDRCLWNREAPAKLDVLAMSMADLEHLHRPEWRSSAPGERIVKGRFPWPRPASCFTPCTRRPTRACSGTLRIQISGEVKSTGAILLGDPNRWRSKSGDGSFVSGGESNSDVSHPSESTGRFRPNMLTSTMDSRSRAASASEASSIQPSSMKLNASRSDATTATETRGTDTPSASGSHTTSSLHAAARPTSNPEGHSSRHSTPQVVVSPSNSSTVNNPVATLLNIPGSLPNTEEQATKMDRLSATVSESTSLSPSSPMLDSVPGVFEQLAAGK